MMLTPAAGGSQPGAGWGRTVLRFLPPCSPDVNPIETAFTKLRALLGKAAERAVDGRRSAIGRLHDPLAGISGIRACAPGARQGRADLPRFRLFRRRVLWRSGAEPA